MDHIGVVIPAYNAEKTLGGLISSLIESGFDRETIIVVDDGSKDKTASLAMYYNVDVIRNEKNMGKGASLDRGFKRAISKGIKKVFTIDADGQHRVSDIQKFLKKENEYELVIGMRLKNSPDMPFIRWVVNRTTSLVISLLSKKYIPDVQSGFRLIDLKIFDKIKLRTKNFQTESELIYKTIKNGYRVGYVPIKTLYNSERSYIMPILDTIRFINMAVRFLWG
ncbi:MAG: glycosyltransferase family 2 protein [candidate division WOR-3 bacterium]